ncbi:MAG: histidine kinase [Burkholderiales bacterium]|nr:histidine kinase [Burkholderiales bacterium]
MNGAHDARYNVALHNARKRVKEIRSFYISLAIFAIIIPCLWVINAFTPGPRWAHWPTIGLGMAMLVHGLSVFAGRSFFGTEWEQKKVDEIMAREKLRVVSNEKQLVQAQMRMLQAQIEPHFLFNTLANIQSLINRSPERANLMMDNFIAYLRQSLSASRSQEGTVRQETELLRHYLELIKIRMGERLHYTFDVDPALTSAPLAPMLLQPLVENAIKHGLEPKVEGGRVDVRIAREPGATVGADVRMRLTVRDNGLGFGEHADSADTGVGLANLRERLHVLYDGRATLTVADANPGTEITLRVPVSPLQSTPSS